MRHALPVSILALLFLAPSPARAHKGHRAPASAAPASLLAAAPPASPAPAGEDAGEAPAAAGPEEAAPDGAAPEEAAPDGAASGDAAPEEAAPEEAAPEEAASGPFEGVTWRDALFGHFHNKLVHFPLAFGLASAVILVLAPRWPAYEPAGRVLLVAAAALAVGAYFSGQAQQEPFVGSPLERALDLHRLAGLLTAVSLWLAVPAAFAERARRLRPAVGVWLLVALSVTGFLGGVLSHS